MLVRVKLLGVFREFAGSGGRAGAVDLDFETGDVTLASVRERLRIPADYPRLVFLGGRPVEDDHVLCDGDEVVFVSPVAGG